MHSKEIRWKQRHQNLQRAFAQLQKGLALKQPNEIEKQGIIQSFEFTFELAWKTLKDYLESQQIELSFPRDVIKQAFHHQLISDGDTWLHMLENRNRMAHTYNEVAANAALQLIQEKYFAALQQVVQILNQKKE